MSFIQVTRNQKSFVRMNNQSEKGFDLIILKSDVFNQIISELNSDEKINLAWELKNERGYKVYYNINLTGVKDNINPFNGGKIDGKVLSFTCVSTESFSRVKTDIGKGIYKSTKKWKDYTMLERALKLSNLKQHKL